MSSHGLSRCLTRGLVVSDDRQETFWMGICDFSCACVSGLEVPGGTCALVCRFSQDCDVTHQWDGIFTLER